MSQPLVTAEDLIRRAPVGSCLYSLSRLDAEAEEVDFLIREETLRIRTWQAPEIEFRMGVHAEGPILLVPILIRVHTELYECWINHWADGSAQRALGTLAIQDRLVLHFYGDEAERVRSLRVSNPHQPFCREAARLCAATAPWSMTAFDAARERIYTQYPTAEALWHSILHQRRKGE